MKKITLYSTLLLLMASLSSCEIIGGIFKAGVWTGIIVVVIVVVLLIWLLSRLGGKK